MKKITAIVLVSIFICLTISKAQQTDMAMGSNLKITNITIYNSPEANSTPLPFPGQSFSTLETPSDNSIDSPPIGGFVPLIAITTTDAMIEDEMTVGTSPFPTGNYTMANPTQNYIIGLFDTGASICIFSNEKSLELIIIITL